jgi:CRISPR/Cas system-associated exonuclease Cas4 (RecB family)
MVKKLLKSTIEKKVEKDSINLDVIIQKINEGYLLKEKRGTRFQKKERFSPSSLVYNHGECPRFWYLAFEGGTFKDDNTPMQYANMDNGTKTHERIKEALRPTGIVIEEEKPVSVKYPPIFGYADLLLDINSQKVLGEIKTVSSEGFERIQLSGKPRSYHVLQLLIYMKILDLPTGAIIYENKNTHELLVFPVTVTEHYKDYIKYLFGWMEQVYDAWKQKTLPKRPYRSKTKVCQKCPLVETCYSMEDGEVDIKRIKPFEL